MQELSVMGIAEVLPRLPNLLARINQTAEAAIRFDPAAVVLIDSPDFSLRVAARIKRKRPRTRIVQYVLPSIWAWRRGRAKKIRKLADHVLCILPFEPGMLEAEDIPATFVGHPAADGIRPTEEDIRLTLSEIGAKAENKLVSVLPGSRKSEVSRLLPVLLGAIHHAADRIPEVKPVILVAENVEDTVESVITKLRVAPTLMRMQGRSLDEVVRLRTALFDQSIAALAASGTVTLELAAAGTPMIVTYDFNRITRMILKAMIRVQTVSLVNLVAETDAIPELLGERCQPQLLGKALTELLTDNEKVAAQVRVMETVMEKLASASEPAGVRAARAVSDLIQQNQLLLPR